MNTAIVAQPTPVKLSVAFRFGLEDAGKRAPFAPEMYFTRKSDKVLYAIGYELIRGASEATRQFTHAA